MTPISSAHRRSGVSNRRRNATFIEAFGKFVAPAVVDRLAEHPDRLVFGGETRELTVLFCDLRNFSGLSEGMSAPRAHALHE